VTSADVVRTVKQRLGCKTGHLGTLDPFASGVLPLCLGDGTKIAQFLNTADKEYTGSIRLGSATDTGDLTGAVTTTADVPALSPRDVARVATRFLGACLQMPPMYSAIKQRGTPLYKLARQGVTVERTARPVRIDALQLTDEGDGRIGFAVACSKGTYIRVLAQEIAVALGSVGHLETLRRTRFGRFRVEETIALETVARNVVSVIPIRDALAELREIQIDAAAARRVQQGFQPLLASIPPGGENEAVKLVAPDGTLTSVIVMDGVRQWRFARVFRDRRQVPL
jgi:tRNA pseudouridine55 synthase